MQLDCTDIWIIKVEEVKGTLLPVFNMRVQTEKGFIESEVSDHWHLSDANGTVQLTYAPMQCWHVPLSNEGRFVAMIAKHNLGFMILLLRFRYIWKNKLDSEQHLYEMW